MNNSLADPFDSAHEYPESLTGQLSTALKHDFHRRETYLDQDRDIRPAFDSIAKATFSLPAGWSRNSRYLLSSSQDWKCVLWDLHDGARLRTVRFEAPVYIAEMHPYNHLLFVASVFEDQPVLVDISAPVPVKRQLPSAPKRPEVDGESISEKQAAQDAKQTTCITIFTALGDHIIAGTSKGWLNIIETRSCKIIHSTRICNNGFIILLRLTAAGQDMVANCSDRVIRTIPVGDLSQLDFNPENIKLEVEHKFQDVVNRLSWNHVAFSSTGDYVTASTYMNHDIYLWERRHGSLVKILEGPKEELGVVEWHPIRPFLVACGLDTGRIYLFSINTPQRWSALAPDFAEVEENVEYIEHEDEFDIHPIEEIQKRRLDLEDELVDVLSVQPVKNEIEEDTFRMPVLLDIVDSESEEEIVAVGPGTMRRRSPSEWMNGNQATESGDEKGTKRPAATIGSTTVPSRSRKR